MAPCRRRKRGRLPFPFSPFARSLSFAISRNPKRKSKQPNSSTNPEPIRWTKRSLPSPSSSDDGEREEVVEMVRADFGFFDPRPGDFGGVKLLLRGYLGTHPWDLAGFVDLILAQTTVGTVVKSEGDDDDQDEDEDDDDEEGIYAVVSALNLSRYAGHRCMADLKEYVLGVCGDEGVKKKMELLFGKQARDVGLLVSQRFVNCPHQLVLPLYDALFDEVSWATEDEPTEELRDFFQFKYYLLITRVFMNKSVHQHKARTSHNLDDPIIYKKAEDEIFHELSSFSFTYNVQGEQLAPHELRNYREMGLVMVVEAKEVHRFREKLKSLLAET